MRLIRWFLNVENRCMTRNIFREHFPLPVKSLTFGNRAMNSTNALGFRIHAILMKWILLWWKISDSIQAKMVSQSGQTMYSNACVCIYAICLCLCEWERKTDSNNYWRTWIVYLWLCPRHCWLLVFSLIFLITMCLSLNSFRT